MIKKVCVLGSGTMGSQIACHFANIGVDVLLLDIVPKKLTEEERKKSRTLHDPLVRNRIARENLNKAVRAKPAPLYKKSFQSRISVGNFEDDLERIKEADWIVEAVLEKKDIKRSLYEQVEKYRRPGTLITSNTSGIPIRSLIEGRSTDFQEHFCGVHFFNPPRYLQLLEIIPTERTRAEVVDFLNYYGDINLGKTTITCRDTPAFIGNRIGVYAIMLTIQLMQEQDLSVKEVDLLTGKFVGRPKSATFRTSDLVGIDILAEVARGIYENCPDDEERAVFQLPDFMQTMLDKGWLGEKTGSGFYQKTKDQQGQTQILELDIDSMTYRTQKKPRYLLLEELKAKDSTEEKLRTAEEGNIEEVGFWKKWYLQLFGKKDSAALDFYRAFYYRLLAYCSHRIPEISDEFYKVDYALRDGFGWDMGPFEIWDVFGVEETVGKMEAMGYPPARWVRQMLKRGVSSFYKVEEGQWFYYDYQSASGSYERVPGTGLRIFLDNYREDFTVWSNDSCHIIDIGDGVLNVEFTSKNNTLDMGVMDGLHRAIDLAENDPRFRAIVIGNEGKDFSLGANLAMIGTNAYRNQMEEVRQAVERFQQTLMRLRYCQAPVVAAPHGKTLGGGAELCMHADRVQAAAETYMGLVETGVGLIPSGGGVKEFVRRAAEHYRDGVPETPHLQHLLLTIAEAKVSTSALEAFDLGYLRPGTDGVTLDRHRLLLEAKREALQLAERGYAPPRRRPIPVLGRNALSFFYSGIENNYRGNYITEYDRTIARKLAYVMCGGDLHAKQEVSPQYLLDLERSAFMELVNNRKTLNRIEHMLVEGEALRN